jgi:hypothetical protein
MSKTGIILSSLFVLMCLPQLLHADCGEGIEVVRDQLAAEEAGVRAIEHRVRTARAEFLSRDTALREMMNNPPADYDRDLARRLVALRRSEVEPKREMLERLRAQHEEGRREWERGRQLLQTQLTEARAALDTQTIDRQEYCRVREAYLQALSLYRDGMQGYRTGMDFYARALAAYGERFLLPYVQGFSDRRQWVVLIEQLNRGDFLQDLLVPMTANVLRSSPPTVPP